MLTAGQMSPNPYQAPPTARLSEGPDAEMRRPLNRTPFILAGIGAGLASAYWAALTLLIGFGVAAGSVSAFQVILPCVLIALYALRGFQLLKGDPNAAKRVLWLHGVGGVMALLQIFSGSTLLVVLQGIKFGIHIFGGVTAYMAGRAFAESQSGR